MNQCMLSSVYDSLVYIYQSCYIICSYLYLKSSAKGLFYCNCHCCVQLLVKDERSTESCISIGDPHLRTFDGAWVESFKVPVLSKMALLTFAFALYTPLWKQNSVCFHSIIWKDWTLFHTVFAGIDSLCSRFRLHWKAMFSLLRFPQPRHSISHSQWIYQSAGI